MIYQACGLNKKERSDCFVLFWRRHLDSNLGIEVLQTFALPLGYGAILLLYSIPSLVLKSNIHVRMLLYWSGLRGSNPPPQPWQGCALPNELNPHIIWCLRSESNQRHGDFQSPALPTELQRRRN